MVFSFEAFLQVGLNRQMRYVGRINTEKGDFAHGANGFFLKPGESPYLICSFFKTNNQINFFLKDGEGHPFKRAYKFIFSGKDGQDFDRYIMSVGKSSLVLKIKTEKEVLPTDGQRALEFY